MMNTLNLKKSQSKPDGRVIEFALNAPQMLVHMVQAWITWLIWGRGTGKTVGGIAPWMIRVAEAMPGHLSGVFGKTFEHLDNNIMPKIFLGFAQLGFQKDVDYVVGIRPPAHWPKCLYPLKDYKRTITWRNGTTFQQVSLHNKGSANAFDFQSGVFDEAKFHSAEQLEDEVFPTFRGFENLFSHLPEYLSKIFCTDKMMDYALIKWILDKRELVDHDKVQKVIELQEKLNELELACETATSSQKVLLQRAIKKITRRLRALRKDLVFVSEASARENIENLGMAWFKDKVATMSKYEFNVAIDNLDPVQAKDGFYPGLNDECQYQETIEDADCVSTSPFIIAMDYQHSISPMCVAQIAALPGNNFRSLNFINEFYTLYPLGLEECVDLFCDYYKSHACKRVYYVYDQTAIGKRVSAVTVSEIVIARLKKKGWNVIKVYTGDTPEHYDKYTNINQWFAAIGKFLPVYFNKSKCIYTLLSIQGAGTKVSEGKTKKDKEFENTKKYPDVDQRITTHFSDTFDMIAWAVNFLKVIKGFIGSRGGGVGVR